MALIWVDSKGPRTGLPRDENGLIVCPNCGKHYAPVLGERPVGDNRPIQIIFPNSKSWEREQLISGICSDYCWQMFLDVNYDEVW